MLTTVVLGLVLALVTFDMIGDWRSGAGGSHLTVEALVALLSLVGITAIWSRNLVLARRVDRLGQDLERVRADAAKWKEENAQLMRGLSAAIDRQFAEWGLTPAEKEIAIFLIKGMSLKEIAAFRHTTERTVRQQTIALYSKAGLSGRAELAAYFLEDLLPA